MRACKVCGCRPADHRSIWCMDCYRAHKAGKQAEIAMDDDARLARVTDTHQTCRGCGIDLYRVVDWMAEARRCNRRWFCGRECFEDWRFRTF